MAKLTLNGVEIEAPRRRAARRGHQAERHLHLQPLLHRRPAAVRRLPHLPRRDRGRARPAARLHRAASPTAWSCSTETPAGARTRARQVLSIINANHSRPLPHLPPPRAVHARRHLPARRHRHAPLPHLREELPLRAADDERDARDGRTSSRGWAKSAPTTRPSSPSPTAPTPSSSSTRRCASSAPAASAPATRSATPARSRSPAAASRRASPSAPAAPSTSRTATSAAPASTSARRRR